jgi:hypothetical protein
MKITDTYIDFGGSVYYYDKVNKLPHDKENALLHFIVMICKSWTFERMTDQEKENCINALIETDDYNALKGNWEARFYILHAVYNAFLSGLGYTHGGSWREAV